MLNPQQFTNKSQEALQQASYIANENNQPQIEPPHLFMALIEQRDGVVISILEKLNVDIDQLHTQIQNMIQALPKQFGTTSGGLGQILMGQAMLHVLQNAQDESKKWAMLILV